MMSWIVFKIFWNFDSDWFDKIFLTIAIIELTNNLQYVKMYIDGSNSIQ